MATPKQNIDMKSEFLIELATGHSYWMGRVKEDKQAKDFAQAYSNMLNIFTSPEEDVEKEPKKK